MGWEYQVGQAMYPVSKNIMTQQRQSFYLSLDAPIERWDEGLPLGNGCLGVLVWGAGRRICLSVDKGDLWDIRPAKDDNSFNWKNLKEWVKAGDMDGIRRVFDTIYYKPNPTKLPTGRIELLLDTEDHIQRFELDYHRALSRIVTQQSTITLYTHASIPVGMVLIVGGTAQMKITSAFSMEHENVSAGANSPAALGYPSPRQGREEALSWIEQPCYDNLRYVIAAGQRCRQDRIEIAFTVVSSCDQSDPVISAKEIVKQALNEGFDQLLKSHMQWWSRYWAKSSVSIPSPEIERCYIGAQYYYGSASRKGHAPMPLQGLWTADEGTLPPWKGDYHNDLNTQMTYWAYQTANHLDEGACFLDFLWNRMDVFRAFARDFYAASGACVPGVMDFQGHPLGGWPQYSLSPVHSAWLAHNFYLHWRYSMDKTFLREQAYPFCSEIAACLIALLEEGNDGKLYLPLSSSPEMHDDRLEAWLPYNSNYDISLLRWLMAATAELAQELGRQKDQAYYQGILKKLPDLAVSETTSEGVTGIGPLMVCQGQLLNESHRHFSHAMSIYPLAMLHIEGCDRDRQVIKETIHQMDRLGTGLWVGFSFTWMACMAARCGLADRAVAMLDVFLRAFVSRNGFNLNGDYKNQGFSCWKYRPFTLEANFAAAQAVHEILLQSWGGVVRIFPSLPAGWLDAAFDNLRTEGAFRVSAKRRQGNNEWVRLYSEKGGTVVLKNPFGGKLSLWKGAVPIQEQGNFIFKMNPGQWTEGKVNNVSSK